jgi:tetraacyldisaccharide 4'-kinase
MLLAPFGVLYGLGSWLRFKLAKPYKAPIPVICVGNLVVGGAGKTPTTIAIAHYLKERGMQPHILSRGYGASIISPTLVDPDLHKASEVGDEPLLLAQVAPTWIYKDRIISSQRAWEAGADILIMDDGFQNPRLYKDISLLVVDGRQGFGNGRVFPAGPLRESPSQGTSRADGIVMIGYDEHGLTFQEKPILKASLRCKNVDPKRVLAFTGLGFPEKFQQTLMDANYQVVGTQFFPDHHPYNHEEIRALVEAAEGLSARLITTEKDILRIPLEYHPHIDVLKIEVIFEKINLLEDLFRKNKL